jgi:hypothetical protein
MNENFNLVLQKFMLYKHFIEHEDPESLQQVTDISVNTIGEIKSLYELAIAFSECNRVQQAKKIFMVSNIFIIKNIIKVIYLYVRTFKNAKNN